MVFQPGSVAGLRCRVFVAVVAPPRRHPGRNLSITAKCSGVLLSWPHESVLFAGNGVAGSRRVFYSSVFEGFQFLSSFGFFSRNTSFKSLLWRFHRYVAMSTMSERGSRTARRNDAV